jgi:hypothetical protein
MTTRESILLSVRWGSKFLIDPCLYRFETAWLRHTTMRGLLEHVLSEVSPDKNYSLIKADEIMVSVVQHIEDCTIGGNKKAVKINASRMMDEEVYIVLRDVPTRQIDFMVKPVENIDAGSIVVNAFDVLRGATSRDRVLLPSRRDTLDNTTDDVLHNDIITWLEKNESGWPRDEANELGRDFVNRLTAAFFPLTSAMFSAMSDVNNAGMNPRSLMLYFHIIFNFLIVCCPYFCTQ